MLNTQNYVEFVALIDIISYQYCLHCDVNNIGRKCLYNMHLWHCQVIWEPGVYGLFTFIFITSAPIHLRLCYINKYDTTF